MQETVHECAEVPADPHDFAVLRSQQRPSVALDLGYPLEWVAPAEKAQAELHLKSKSMPRGDLQQPALKSSPPSSSTSKSVRNTPTKRDSATIPADSGAESVESGEASFGVDDLCNEAKLPLGVSRPLQKQTLDDAEDTNDGVVDTPFADEVLNPVAKKNATSRTMWRGLHQANG